MAFGRLLSVLVVIMMGGSPGGDEGQDRLPGDHVDVLVTTVEGRIECALHHDDWDDVDWEAPLGADGAVQRSLYRDFTSHVLPEGQEWLLMEPAAHEIRRRHRVCLAFSSFVTFYDLKCIICLFSMDACMQNKERQVRSVHLLAENYKKNVNFCYQILKILRRI